MEGMQSVNYEPEEYSEVQSDDYRSAKDVYDIVSRPNPVVCRNEATAGGNENSNNTGGNR